jgi:hypothetical protein
MSKNHKTPVSANGMSGVLLPIGGSMVFRVYEPNGEFTDYDIYHSDIMVTIDDEDAYFYAGKDGETYLDHSPATLGIGEQND